MAAGTPTEEGPFNIEPQGEVDIFAADAYHQANPTHAWLYWFNNSAAQKWWTAGPYNIDGYTGWAVFARYGGHDMCMNVQGSHYVQGTQIGVSNCDTYVGVNELWWQFSWVINGNTPLYTLCASYNTNLCINAKGGVAFGALLIIWNLDQLWPNSLWDFLTA